MTRCIEPQRGNDRGSILPLVLVFVVVLSVLVAALATYTATALRSSDVTDQSISRLTAAESGMQYALSDAAANPASCDGSVVSRGTLNGANLTTQCWRTAELRNLDTLYAVVLTGEGPSGSIVTQPAIDVNGANSDGGVKDINGPVFFGSPSATYLDLDLDNARAVLPDPSNPSDSIGGVVRYEPASGTCPDAAAPLGVIGNWTGTPLRPPTIGCDDRHWDEVAPDLDLTGSEFAAVAVASTTALAPIVDPIAPNCDVFEPGLYPAPPNVTGPSYFRSGVYYFPTGEVRIDDFVVVGKRIGPEFPDGTVAGLHADCLPLWNDAGEDASGAVWIMGTDARVFTSNNSKLNVYGRAITDTATPPRTVDRAIVALTATQATTSGLPIAGATLPINGSVSPAPPKLIDRSNGGNTSMSFYGQIYAPHSWVDTGNAASDVYVEFLSGIVAGRITIKTAANVDGFNISVPTEVVNAFYIESSAVTTTGVGGGQATVRTRSEELVDPLTSARELSVDSWRICERGSC